MKIKHGISSKRYMIITASAILLLAAGLALWLFINRPISNPFNPTIMSQVDFPLYYPSYLPAGYQIEKGSTKIPTEGVVVFNLIGPGGQKIFVSEETRPNTFNLGGYYNNFTHLNEQVTAQGTVATGYIDKGATEIGSIATEKTWILTNTAAPVPLAQLGKMLHNLLVSY